jgi:hypothetical protein
LPVRCALAWAVDRDDGWPRRVDQRGHSLSVQPAPELDDLSVVDKRDIEALARTAYVNSEPGRHYAGGRKIASSSVALLGSITNPEMSSPPQS